MKQNDTTGTTAPTVIIYTDGGCLGNPGPGGWAAILRYGSHTKELTGRASQTTNNRMELRAAIEALNTLNRPCRVEIYTDSEYLRRGITEWVKGWQRNGWKTAAKQPVKNRDLCRRWWQRWNGTRPPAALSGSGRRVTPATHTTSAPTSWRTAPRAPPRAAIRSTWKLNRWMVRKRCPVRLD